MGNRRQFVILLGVLAMAVGFCGCQEQQRRSFIVSSFSQPETWLRPYEWTYLRVDLPSWFSSVVMTFMSDVDIDKEGLTKLSKSRLPVICFKNGSPPLPDVSESYLEEIMSHFLLNGTFGIVQNLGNVEQCIPFQKNLTVVLTNEQISPGVWYLAFFNGLGLVRTQSKMISRGQSYMFRTSINVEGCATSTIWGPQCNQTLNMMSCSQASVDLHSRSLLDVSSNPSVLMSAENLITCNNSYESSCLGYGELKFYFLDIVGAASQFRISTTDFRLSQMVSTNKKEDLDGILLMCYARYNAMPAKNMSDYSADISGEPLIVNSPRIGRWYIAIQTINQTTSSKMMQEKYAESKMCFSFDWQVNECLNGKVGVNCTWTMHMLQRVPIKSSNFPFESYYLPPEENDSTKYADFTMENLLSNSSTDNVSWTYLFLEIPRGAAGSNMHIELTSDTKLGYDMYIKYGQIADFDTWDYYLNSSGSNNGSMFLVSNDSSGVIDLYILYAREGTWCIGLKHPPDALYRYKTSMSIFLEGCPRDCSSNGECHMSVDRSGMTFYSYCTCDRDHGGFDCSDELVSPQGHIWQSVFLIASNAAAILPAFWALRQKAFSEWVLFTSSGISSGLYHACDVGTWCPLSFHVLQFMDFWLSFMAVVSTFVYMTTISESSKRAIHTSVAILTALLAVSGATRSENIIVVIAIGSLGLLVGWLLEYSTANRSINCLAVFDLLINERWQNIKRWLWNLMKTIQKRFRWCFLFLGFTVLALAGTSWKLETDETYWIWHSFWHITIYTSSFFFLCSTYGNSDSERREPEYELTRQNSSRIE